MANTQPVLCCQTFTGDVLLSINPYTPIPSLYDLPSSGLPSALNDAEPPHLHAVAARAYLDMRATGRDQAVLVNGESGAGKTEACKKILRFLARASALQRGHGATEAVDVATLSPLEQCVLDANPVLEAFGNARTIRNDNSRHACA